jgi:hypothetical protein
VAERLAAESRSALISSSIKRHAFGTDDTLRGFGLPPNGQPGSIGVNFGWREAPRAISLSGLEHATLATS